MVWNAVPPERQTLITSLMNGPNSLARLGSALDLIECYGPESGCWQLAVQGKENMARTPSGASRFVGDAIDSDGTPVQAVLMLDTQGAPLELEIFRLDAQEVQIPFASLHFEFVTE